MFHLFEGFEIHLGLVQNHLDHKHLSTHSQLHFLKISRYLVFILIYGLFTVYLPYLFNSRFHVAMHLVNDRLRITYSKCGLKEKCHMRSSQLCQKDVFIIFWHPLWPTNEQTHCNIESIWFNYVLKSRMWNHLYICSPVDHR